MLAKFHRQMFCWLDDWIDLTMEDIRKIENEIAAELSQVCRGATTTAWLPPPPTDLPPIISTEIEYYQYYNRCKR
jgi:hypothetical protein